MLNTGIKYAFLLLVITQGLHSYEEYHHALWTRLALARYASGLVSDNPALGFSVINGSLVLFGFWTYLVPVSRNWASAGRFLWGWCFLELANGIGHILFAVQARGYFPGLYTAPFLLLISAYISVYLWKKAADPS